MLTVGKSCKIMFMRARPAKVPHEVFVGVTEDVVVLEA
jgi:hypothetical protein